MIFYYGCIREIGHYYWESGEYGAYKARRKELPWWPGGKPTYGGPEIPDDPNKVVPWGYHVDGALQPKGKCKYGEALLHHKDGWTALAFWDSTVDHRPGSSSTFVTDEILDFDAMLAKSQKAFPEVFDRLPFPVVPWRSADLL